MNSGTSYTIDGILQSLGYVDPLMAARQQARMILLGRLSRYQAAVQALQSKWGLSLAQMREKYEATGSEDFDADDDYAQWQWYTDAIAAIESQLNTLKTA
ncbi:MAG: hypothetical protein H6662_16045 [Ardenticatenaceae bacterium]|nr:hypothetical protein [Anaerolineales bacterium]MCB8923099.1 hypothetical protein [Ardenticatenaceae bacterium]MCB8990034.1 hypothetical protein [Ardenticatenaceae bacterium]